MSYVQLFSIKEKIFQTYSIFDLSGKSVASGNIANEESHIDVRHLAAGNYIVKLTGSNKEVSKEIVKINSQN